MGFYLPAVRRDRHKPEHGKRIQQWKAPQHRQRIFRTEYKCIHRWNNHRNQNRSEPHRTIPVLSVRNSTNPSETYRTLIHRHIDFSVSVFPQAVPVRSHTCHPAALPDTPACSPPPPNIFRFQEQRQRLKQKRK